MNPTYVENELVVCSAYIKAVRVRFPSIFRSWITDLFPAIPVHTFIVDSKYSKYPADRAKNYWYCAGDHLKANSPGVTQALVTANLDLVKCLVAPDIKDDDIMRPEKVIGGEYGLNYVCHNIANRVLFACNFRGYANTITLADLDIPIHGYSFVVKSALGVYGQDLSEWSNRVKACNCTGRIFKDPSDFSQSRKNEIDKIHVAAALNMDEYRLFNNDLAQVDNEYLKYTKSIYEDFQSKKTSIERYNGSMVHLARRLYEDTAKKVGSDAAERIFPGFSLFPSGNDGSGNMPQSRGTGDSKIFTGLN